MESSDPRIDPRESTCKGSMPRVDAHPYPSTFDRLYESDDEKLVLFETKEGHLIAVDASKLV